MKIPLNIIIIQKTSITQRIYYADRRLSAGRDRRDEAGAGDGDGDGDANANAIVSAGAEWDNGTAAAAPIRLACQNRDDVYNGDVAY